MFSVGFFHFFRKKPNPDYYFYLFIFSCPCNSRKSIVFGSNFRNGNLDGFTRYEVPWIQKSHFLAFGLCLCYVKNKMTPETKFYIYIIDRATWNFLWKLNKNSVYRASQKNSNTLRSMEGISSYWIFFERHDCTKCNKNNIHFCTAQHMWTTE